MSYKQIKELAREHSLRVRDLLALSVSHDPFYVGRPMELQMAQWAAEIYKTLDRKHLYLRGIHYRLVSREGLLRWDGQPYLNTKACWNGLNLAFKYARYLRLIPYDALEDRKHPQVIENALYWNDKSVDDAVEEYLTAEYIAEKIVKDFWLCNPRNVQPYHMEIWVEKSDMNHVLMPIARAYGVNLQTSEGEISLTRIWEMIKRVREHDKPVRIFYISDFDPVGQNIPVSASRKIEFFVRTLMPERDIRLDQIALTKEQCIEYQLPRTPLKESDMQKNKFEAQHGAGATELSALEELHPGVLALIVKDALNQYYDNQAKADLTVKNRGIQDAIKKAILEHKEEIEEILAGLDLEDTYKIEEIEIETHELPEDVRDWLYDSAREYMPQIYRYKEHQGDGSGP